MSLAAFLRLWQAGESLWIDELHTSWVVSGKLTDVLPRAVMGNQSPLYFWGMWLLVQVTGQSEWTLRLPSLIAGIALPAAVFYFVGQVFNLSKRDSGQVENLSCVALAAALLVALDPTSIFYAQEARPYACVMLLAVVELLLLRRLIERPTITRRTALLANSLLLFYLHYTTAIFLVGIVVLLPMLVRLAGSAYAMKYLAMDLVVAAVLAAPGVVQMTDIFERRTNWAAFVDKPTWLALVREVPFTLGALIGAATLFAAVVALLVPRVLPGNALTRCSASAAPGVRWHTTGPSKRWLLWYGALLASVLVPLLLSWIVTRLDAARIFHVRYLVALIPLAVTATCLATLWIPWRGMQWAALVVLAGWHLYGGGMIQQFGRDGRFLAARNEDWRGANAYVASELDTRSQLRIILDANLIESLSQSTSLTAQEHDYTRFAFKGLYRVALRGAWCPQPRRLHGRRTRIMQRDFDFVSYFLRERSPTHIMFVYRGNETNARQQAEQLAADAEFILRLVDAPRTWFDVGDVSTFGNVQVVRIDVRTEESGPEHSVLETRRKNR